MRRFTLPEWGAPGEEGLPSLCATVLVTAHSSVEAEGFLSYGCEATGRPLFLRFVIALGVATTVEVDAVEVTTVVVGSVDGVGVCRFEESVEADGTLSYGCEATGRSLLLRLLIALGVATAVEVDAVEMTTVVVGSVDGVGVCRFEVELVRVDAVEVFAADIRFPAAAAGAVATSADFGRRRPHLRTLLLEDSPAT